MGLKIFGKKDHGATFLRAFAYEDDLVYRDKASRDFLLECVLFRHVFASSWASF